MKSLLSGIIIISLCSLVSCFLLSSCSTTSGGVAVGWSQEESPPPPQAPPARHHGHGPPPHAPAWGYRAKQHYKYWYYPDAYVYFDVTRKVYFYLEGDNWRIAASLPRHYRTRLYGYVEIELDSDKPYVYFDKHRREYPPGHWKKKGKRKGKGRKW